MLAKCCLLTGKVRKYIIEETNFLWILENANKFCWIFQIWIFEVLLNFPDLNICFSLSLFSSFDSSLKVSLKSTLSQDRYCTKANFINRCLSFFIRWTFSISLVFGYFGHFCTELENPGLSVLANFGVWWWGTLRVFGFCFYILLSFNPYPLNASVWSLLHSITRLNCH